MATKKAKATEKVELNNNNNNTRGWSEFPLMLLSFPIWEGGQKPSPPPPSDAE